jgi:hypothetical protein
MRAGPRINADDIAPTYGFFNLQRRKYVQYYTVIYCSSIVIANGKVPYLGWSPSLLDAKSTPVLSYIEYQLHHFP